MSDVTQNVSPFFGHLDIIYDDISETEEFYNKKPLLAHYTSLQNLESILSSRELWLANPTLMNDSEELSFGLHKAMDVLITNKELRDAFVNKDYYQIFVSNLEFKYRHFVEKHFPDTYIFCLSEIDRQELDGRLSMWRAYGFDGNGAALVFDAGRIPPAEDPTSLMIIKIDYKTNDERITWLQSKVRQIAQIIRENKVEESDLFAIAFRAFERFKLAAITTKHKGFEEEREWRVIFTPETPDSEKYESMKSYSNGPSGIEPRLKLNFALLEKLSGSGPKFDDILSHFILGPTRSSNLNLISFRRMLDKYGLGSFKDKVAVSSIPYRSRS